MEKFRIAVNSRTVRINTRRNDTPKMVRFPMTKIPGTLDSAQKRWAPGFPRVYFHMIHEYLKLAKWQISDIKKIEKTKPPRVYNGGLEGLELNRNPILEPWNLSPGRGGILDTS